MDKLDKALNEVAVSCAIQEIGEMTLMQAGEGDEWTEEQLTEHGADVWYSAQVYGSSYGPSVDITLDEDLRGELEGEELTEEESTDLDDYASWSVDELVDLIGQYSAENLGDGYAVIAELDDNCIWVVAVPCEVEAQESAEVARA